MCKEVDDPKTNGEESEDEQKQEIPIDFPPPAPQQPPEEQKEKESLEPPPHDTKLTNSSSPMAESKRLPVEDIVIADSD